MKIAYLFAVMANTILSVANASPESEKCNVTIVPDDARISITPKSAPTAGMDNALFPYALPSSYTGCQYLWFGDGNNLKMMRRTFTSYLVEGKVQWVIVTPDITPEYICKYSGGQLVDTSASDLTRCPSANLLERRWNESP